jgi:hypothetical protein
MSSAPGSRRAEIRLAVVQGRDLEVVDRPEQLNAVLFIFTHYVIHSSVELENVSRRAKAVPARRGYCLQLSFVAEPL